MLYLSERNCFCNPVRNLSANPPKGEGVLYDPFRNRKGHVQEIKLCLGIPWDRNHRTLHDRDQGFAALIIGVYIGHHHAEPASRFYHAPFCD